MRKHSRIRVHRFTFYDPSHVRPPVTMWISFLIRELMMHAVSCHPEDRTAL